MKRFFGFSLVMFFALVAIALVGGDSGAVAGQGCHGRKCHGGLLAKLHAKKCHGGLLARHKARKCHGGEAVANECGEAGGCTGEGVIATESVPTEAAPKEPAKT